MPRGKALSKIKFLSINRDIKAALEAKTFHARELADKHGVSHMTIYNVRNAKTWPGYLANRHSGDAPKVASAAKKFEAAQEAGLKPVPTEHRKARQEQIRRHDEFDRAIRDFVEPVNPYVTRGELGEEIRAVHSRVDVLSDVLRGLNRDPLFRALFGRKVRGIIAQRDESKEVA